MKRLLLAACLSAPGLALAQSGGGVVITTPLPPGVVLNPVQPSDPITVGTLPPPSFIFAPVTFTLPKEPMGRSLMGALIQDSTPAIPYALDPGAILHGEQPILTVEEDGVRLPDEQFSLP